MNHHAEQSVCRASITAEVTKASVGFVRRRALELLPLSMPRRQQYLNQLEALLRASARTLNMDERDFGLWRAATIEAILLEIERVELSGGAGGGHA